MDCHLLEYRTAKHIANRMYNEFGHETNIRRCIRLAWLANSHAIRSREDDIITRDIVDNVKWLKFGHNDVAVVQS